MCFYFILLQFITVITAMTGIGLCCDFIYTLLHFITVVIILMGLGLFGVSSLSACFLYIVTTRKTRTAITNLPVKNNFKSECLLFTA